MAEFLGQWLFGYVWIHPKGLDHPLHPQPAHHQPSPPPEPTHLSPKTTTNPQPAQTPPHETPCDDLSQNQQPILVPLSQTRRPRRGLLPGDYHEKTSTTPDPHTHAPAPHYATATTPQQTKPPPTLKPQATPNPKSTPASCAAATNLPQPTPNDLPIPSTQPHTRNKIP